MLTSRTCPPWRPSQMPRIAPKTFGIDGAGHKQRDVADLAGRGSICHYDAIEIKVRMLTLDATVPPSLDLGG